MARNGGQLITTGSVRPIDEQVARWAAVDQAAVKRTIARVFTDDPIVPSASYRVGEPPGRTPHRCTGVI